MDRHCAQLSLVGRDLDSKVKEVPDPLSGPEVEGTQELVTADIASLGRNAVAMLDILATVDQDPGWHRRSSEQEIVQRRSRDPEACPLRAPPAASPAAAADI